MKYYIRANRQQQVLKLLSFKEMAATHTIDYSAWADDGGNVTAVVASVESGQAAISNEALASNVKTLVITTSEVGASMIKLTATAGNNTHIVYMYIFTKDPRAQVSDYGIIQV